MRPLTWREAVERSVAILECGQCPPRREAERMIKALRAMAIAMALGDVCVRPTRRPEPGVVSLSEDLVEA